MSRWNFAPGGIISTGFSASNTVINNSVIGSLNGRNLVATGNGVFVNGKKVDRHSLPSADRIEITALGKNGNRLDSFEFPANASLTLEITAGDIKSVNVTQGSIRVVNAERIEKVQSAAGDIVIDSCKNIEKATTMSGDVKVRDCEHLGSASSMSGIVQVAAQVRRGVYRPEQSKSANKRADSPARERDASPVRKPGSTSGHPSAIGTKLIPGIDKMAEVFKAKPGDRSCPYCKAAITFVIVDDPTTVEGAKELPRGCASCKREYIVKYD
jgi:hypothetical protein